jgi:iron(III) transport system substrate-binding protein
MNASADGVHPRRRCLARIGAAAVGLAGLAACQGRPAERSVVVYTSVDQPQAEPLLKAFEQRSGIRVRAVYDVEATRTVGLAARLLAERASPQADVFWSGEFLQTLMLAREGVLAPYRSPAAEDLPAQLRDADGHWTPLAGRARVLLANTTQIEPSQVPRSLAAFAELAASGRYRGRVGIAHPLFGTTATHAAALYAAWGPERARAYFASLKQSGVRVLDGNSVVRDQVARGELAVGLTDTDDACAAVQRGAPVEMVLPDQQAGGLGTLVIPGSVALIAGAPHPAEARALIDELVGPDAERRMLASGWSDIPYRPQAAAGACGDIRSVRAIASSFTDIAAQLARSRRELGELYLR